MASAMMTPVPVQADDAWESPSAGTPKLGFHRLSQRHRRAFDAEIEHAKNLMLRHQLDPEEDIYSHETLDRAINFLKRHIRYAWESCGAIAPIPTIGTGPGRSIDLYWKQSTWKLLVNIPASEGAEATFYGDDYGRNKTEGILDANVLSRTVISWLIA